MTTEKVDAPPRRQDSVETSPANSVEPAARPSARAGLRRLAIAAWLGALGVQVVGSGISFDAPSVLVWLISGVIAFSVGRRPIHTVLVDFLPLAAVILAWVYLRGAAMSFGMPALWTPQITFDKWLFFGVEPTVWLQEHLRYATPRWWDVPVTLCYASFFVLPWVTAGVLWLRDRSSFYSWSWRYVVLSFIGFAVFALLPSAPPWAAGRCDLREVASRPDDPACLHQAAWRTGGGLLGKLDPFHAGGAHAAYVVRDSFGGLKELHLKLADHLIANGQGASDAMAAVPSLHAGMSMLFAIFMWRRVRRWWRPVLVGYPLLMAFTLVYTGEHYVFDILMGWLAAGLVCMVATAIERRRRGRDTSSVLADPAHGTSAGKHAVSAR